MSRFFLFFLIMGGSAWGQVSSIASPLPESVVSEIYCRACAHFFPEKLPVDSPYRLDHAICGTSAIVGLASKWNELPVAAKQTFATLFQRPVMSASIDSPSGHFRIHFNRTGIDAVSPTDDDGNGAPDYVDETARVFDAVWELEVNQLGYHPPPSDGDNIYDIYILNLARQNAYGFTYPIAYPENVTPSYMEIDNDFLDSIYHTRGLDGLRVTAAHEFYHALQFGYYADFDAAWWQELTATWMEDVAYPDINDFYQYVSCSLTYRCIFDFPEMALDTPPGASLHPFGGALFAHHLEQVYGDASLRNVWEQLLVQDPKSYSLSLIDQQMPMGGFAQVLPRFSLWNYLTNTRSRPGYYTEASDLASVKYTDVSLVPGGSFTGSASVDRLGTTFLRVGTSGLSGGVRANFTLGSGGQWTILVALVSQGRVEMLWPKSTSVVIPNANRYQEVVFIPMVTSLTGTNVRLDYALSAGPGNSGATDFVGDLNDDAAVNFTDFVSFAQGYGKRYLDPDYVVRADLNGDGPVDFQDFLIFVSHFGESK